MPRCQMMVSFRAEEVPTLSRADLQNLVAPTLRRSDDEIPRALRMTQLRHDTGVGMDRAATGMVTGVAATIWRRRGSASRRASAPSLPGVQDGGVVSALLIELLESGEIDGALVAKPSETRAVERRGAPRADAGGRHRLRRQLLQPDAGAGAPRSQEIRPARETAHRSRRHPLRDPGLAGDAAAAVLLGGVQGRRRRPDRRPALHQELRLRGADAAGDRGAARYFAAGHRQDRHHPRQALPL